MGRLVKGIEGQPVPGVGNCRLELALRTMPVHQAIQGSHQLAAKALSFEELPIVKVVAILQTEAAEELAANQVHGLSQGAGTGGACLGGRVVVGLATGQTAAKLVHIYPGVGAGNQGNLLAIRFEPIVADGLPQRIEGSTKGGTSPAAVELGPEEIDQGIAPVTLARDAEVGQESNGLLPIEADGFAVELDVRRAEQTYG
jgi:hypothetical protein